MCTISEYQWMTTALAMVGKLGVSSSFAIIYLYTAELYPTVLRNFGVGSGSMFARAGSMVSPYIADLVSGLLCRQEAWFLRISPTW